MKKIIMILIFTISIIIYSNRVNSMNNNINESLNNNTFKNKLREELNKKYPLFIIDELLNNTWEYNILDNELYANSYSNILNEEINVYIDCKDLIDFKIDCIVDDNYQNKNQFTLDKNKKTVALTFDDGPGEYTKEIIDLLNENKANATFFILGNKINNNFDKISYIIENNNELGSHTYNHKILNRVKEQYLDYEMNNTTNIIKKHFDYDIKLFRPPYGIINNKIINNYNYSYILWNIDTLDWKSRSANKIYNEVIDNISDGDIILMHETYYSSYKALERILPELYLEGYQITTISNLAALKGYNLELNHKYNTFK